MMDANSIEQQMMSRPPGKPFAVMMAAALPNLRRVSFKRAT